MKTRSLPPLQALHGAQYLLPWLWFFSELQKEEKAPSVFHTIPADAMSVAKFIKFPPHKKMGKVRLYYLVLLHEFRK